MGFFVLNLNQMKNLICILLFITPSVLKAQDTKVYFFNSELKTTEQDLKNKEIENYIEYSYSESKSVYAVRLFSAKKRGGRLAFNSIENRNGILKGEGKIKSIDFSNFENSKKYGEWVEFNEEGKLVKTTIFNESGLPTSIFTHYESGRKNEEYVIENYELSEVKTYADDISNRPLFIKKIKGEKVYKSIVLDAFQDTAIIHKFTDDGCIDFPSYYNTSSFEKPANVYSYSFNTENGNCEMAETFLACGHFIVSNPNSISCSESGLLIRDSYILFKLNDFDKNLNYSATFQLLKDMKQSSPTKFFVAFGGETKYSIEIRISDNKYSSDVTITESLSGMKTNEEYFSPVKNKDMRVFSEGALLSIKVIDGYLYIVLNGVLLYSKKATPEFERFKISTAGVSSSGYLKEVKVEQVID